MLLLKVSPRVDALIELRRLLRSNDRKIATGGTSTSAGFFLKKKKYICEYDIFFREKSLLFSTTTATKIILHLIKRRERE